MTTFIDFVPSSVAPFQFQPTLDGDVYTVIVTWSLFGRRWYINVYDLSQNLIVSLPLIGSPSGVALDNLAWSNSGIVVATATTPHGFLINSVTQLTISGASPTEYNGTFDAFIIDENLFQYNLANDPGDMINAGDAYYNINLIAGYFTTSTMVFRQANQQFEINP